MNWYKQIFRKHPKVGDRVKVAVGFSSYLKEGTVNSVHETYCWIHVRNNKDVLVKTFTASFSYCKFYYL